ncbi:hypothetical protein A3758_24885, partial [Oleiphilus sp. HI0118]
ELVNGEPTELRFNAPSELNIETVLSMRIDRQNRLWLLDYANHGSGTPQIVAIDLSSMDVVHHYVFESDIAPLGSHLNDFQVDPTGRYIFIADASIFGLSPALIVYEVQTQSARRVIEDHDSVDPDNFIPFVEGEKMLMLGVFAIRPGVDSIALDRNGEWLYFAPVTDNMMHRIRVADLLEPNLPKEALYGRIEAFAEKTMSDGITTDNAGNIYISDLEHSAIIVMSPSGEMKTLYKDKKLR